MTTTLAPNLQKITVDFKRLILDPNNPRFTTRKEDTIGEEHFVDLDISGQTEKKMAPNDSDRYKIAELVSSIKQNGWLPVDSIFVRKLDGEANRYVVLEGNRRVSAIRKIMGDPTSPELIKQSLQSIEVMEVLDNGSNEDLQKKITYLLGVRHHGSLRRWTPFAQARNIFNLYVDRSQQSTENFEWRDDVGRKVADTLSIPVKEVKERLMVYRVMSQIGRSQPLEGAAAKMEDRYYSICREPLFRGGLATYIRQDPSTFLLNDEGVTKMVNLCHFDKLDREGAPIKDPTEWRALEKIVGDEDLTKRKDMLKQVEEDKSQPSDVWAVRSKELIKYTWELWLLEVKSVLQRVTVAELTNAEPSRPVVTQLSILLDQLDTRDVH
jgi:hypothetical protein